MKLSFFKIELKCKQEMGFVYVEGKRQTDGQITDRLQQSTDCDYIAIWKKNRDLP